VSSVCFSTYKWLQRLGARCRKLWLSPAIVFCTFGCVTSPRPAPLGERLASVDVSDGVDEREANLIAEGYLLAGFGGAEGAIWVVASDGDNWVAASAFGALGFPGPSVLINKTTGGVAAEGAPSFENLDQLMRALSTVGIRVVPAA
jgi:hypothetical protein